MAVVSAAARDLAMVVGRVQISSVSPSPGGGIGRRAVLRRPCPYGYEGSTPSWGTMESEPARVLGLAANERALHGVKIMSSALRRE